MKLFYLIFAFTVLMPIAVLAEQQGWGNSSKQDLDQIDEPEESDAPLAPVDEQAKRAPADNPEPRAKLKPANSEDAEDNYVEDEVETKPKWTAAKLIKLQGLNKVTARTSEINTKIGDKVKFGNLEIKVEKCMRGPDSEKPDNTALMTIWDGIPGQDKKQVFHGWMFSSSPALSALENPIYDVILISCSDK